MAYLRFDDDQSDATRQNLDKRIEKLVELLMAGRRTVCRLPGAGYRRRAGHAYEMTIDDTALLHGLRCGMDTQSRWNKSNK